MNEYLQMPINIGLISGENLFNNSFC